jgi:hypothetical protein
MEQGALKIEHEPGEGGGDFWLLDEAGTVRGELTYVRDGASIVVTHTRVDEALRGGGLGARLVKAALAWSRGERLEIRATCWYARDVLAALARAKR